MFISGISVEKKVNQKKKEMKKGGCGLERRLLA